MKQLAMITSVLAVILTIVIIFSFVSGSTTTIEDASKSISEGNNCSENTGLDGSTLTYNASDGGCYMANSSFQVNATMYELPLRSMFAESGVLWLITMAALMIFIVVLVFVKVRYK